jgi:hypothetical protein
MVRSFTFRFLDVARKSSCVVFTWDILPPVAAFSAERAKTSAPPSNLNPSAQYSTITNTPPLYQI